MHYYANGEPVICFNLPSPAHYSDKDGEVATVVISDGSSEDSNAVVPPPFVDIAVPRMTAKLNGPTTEDPIADDPTADDAEEDATADGAEEDEDAVLLAMPIPQPAGPSENWHFGYWLEKTSHLTTKMLSEALAGTTSVMSTSGGSRPTSTSPFSLGAEPQPATSQDESLCALNLLRVGLVDWIVYLSPKESKHKMPGSELNLLHSQE